MMTVFPRGYWGPHLKVSVLKIQNVHWRSQLGHISQRTNIANWSVSAIFIQVEMLTSLVVSLRASEMIPFVWVASLHNSRPVCKLPNDCLWMQYSTSLSITMHTYIHICILKKPHKRVHKNAQNAFTHTNSLTHSLLHTCTSHTHSRLHTYTRSLSAKSDPLC